MHSSAQAATVLNIRNLLITAVALLSLLGLAVSGYVLHNASVDRAIASDAASINETADLLLESAGQWARERGATNLALNAANPREETYRRQTFALSARHHANDTISCGRVRGVRTYLAVDRIAQAKRCEAWAIGSARWETALMSPAR